MFFFRLLVILGCLVPLDRHSVTLAGRIVGISDGDTVTLLDVNKVQHRIRIAGIDAPEKKQAFGTRSKSSLSDMAFNRAVEADCRKADRYQRQVCVVYVNGKDIGLEQIRTGMAWWYREYSKEQTLHERREYEQAESQAQRRQLGIWSHSNPVPPWQWRRDRRNSSRRK